MNPYPSIYDYIDFRKYLSDWFDSSKKINSRITKSMICHKLGMKNSRSYFQDVLNGKFVSDSKIEDFLRVLKFSSKEAKYFRILVHYNQATQSHEEREIYFEQLITLNHTPKVVLTRESYTYYKNWYHSPIRAVLNVYNFKNKYSDLAKIIEPAITPKQARESILLLNKLGLIKKNSQGFYKPTEKTLSTEAYAKDEIILQHQANCLELARGAILRQKKYPQRVITRTLSVSELAYKRIERRIEKFKNEIGAIIHNDHDTPDRIYQLDLVLFPMAKPPYDSQLEITPKSEK